LAAAPAGPPPGRGPRTAASALPPLSWRWPARRSYSRAATWAAPWSTSTAIACCPSRRRRWARRCCPVASARGRKPPHRPRSGGGNTRRPRKDINGPWPKTSVSASWTARRHGGRGQGRSRQGRSGASRPGQQPDRQAAPARRWPAHRRSPPTAGCRKQSAATTSGELARAGLPPSAPRAPDLAASAAHRRFPYLSVLAVPAPFPPHFQEGPGRLGVAHGEGAEVPFGEHQAVQLRLSGDLRRTVTVGFVDECHFPEVV